MKTKIQNIDDLRAEVLRLRIKRTEQEIDLQVETRAIASRFRIPLMLLGKLNDWFGGSGGLNRSDPGSKAERDWVTSVFRIGIPVMMDKFIFPRSGFIVKSIVELLSQKAAKTLNMDVMSGWIEKFSEWTKSSKQHKRKDAELADYGIPPDSETY